MTENNNLNELRANSDGEISLVDIVEFIQESWKQLILAGVVGAGYVTNDFLIISLPIYINGIFG